MIKEFDFLENKPGLDYCVVCALERGRNEGSSVRTCLCAKVGNVGEGCMCHVCRAVSIILRVFGQ